MKRVVESYRRIRNTLRFLLANTSDFDPRDARPADRPVARDRPVRDRASRRVLQAERPRASRRVRVPSGRRRSCRPIAPEDLGGFYLDILKDRLYTSAADGPARRSAQNALWHITQALLRLLAPFLSFTAEEAWAIFAPEVLAERGTIFAETAHTLPPLVDADRLLHKWNVIREIRASVLKKLEDSRTAGLIGSSLQAEIELHVPSDRYGLLLELKNDLRFVMITSQAVLHEAAHETGEAIVVAPSTHPKCDRCWHYRSDVGRDASHATLCGRCVSNLFGAGEVRSVA